MARNPLWWLPEEQNRDVKFFIDENLSPTLTQVCIRLRLRGNLRPRQGEAQGLRQGSRSALPGGRAHLCHGQLW